MPTSMFLTRLVCMLLFIALWRHYVLPAIKARALSRADEVEKNWMRLWIGLTWILSA